MSKFHCQGCKKYQPRPEFRKIGLGAVCSEECLMLVAGKRSEKHHRTETNPIPTETRSRVLARDRSRCRWCGATTDMLVLHLHHIKYRSEGVDHSERNLITLCAAHHEAVHGDKRYWKPILEQLIVELYHGQEFSVPQMIRRVS